MTQAALACRELAAIFVTGKKRRADMGEILDPRARMDDLFRDFDIGGMQENGLSTLRDVGM